MSRSAFFSRRVSISGALLGLMRETPASARSSRHHARFRRVPRHGARTKRRSPRACRGSATEREHIVRRVGRARIPNEDLPAIIEAMDQPSIDGVNTWFVAKAAKEAGLKVALSGLGGDELLAGYPSFVDVPRWRRRFGPLGCCAGARAVGPPADHAPSLPASRAQTPKALGLAGICEQLGRRLSAAPRACSCPMS